MKNCFVVSHFRFIVSIPQTHIRVCGGPLSFLFSLLCDVCLFIWGRELVTYVSIYTNVFTAKIQAWVHKGTDNQIFNPINLSKQHNELNISGGSGHGAVLLRALRWSSIKTQYNNYKLTRETRQGSFLQAQFFCETACFVNHNLLDK